MTYRLVEKYSTLVKAGQQRTVRTNKFTLFRCFLQ